MRTLLKEMLKHVEFDGLPSEWTNIVDLEKFSNKKVLWNYQKEALKNSIKMLWKYYEDLEANKEKPFEDFETNKIRLFEWYKNNGLTLELEKELSIKLKKKKDKINELLTIYFEVENGTVPFYNYINRMGFWMATGSGKTLIIVKLIEILLNLMEENLIPKRNILFLTHRDDLLKQFERYIEEFNQSIDKIDKRIHIKDLREYPEEKRALFTYRRLVFYYRADNMSNIQKEKLVDFKNYYEQGNWYVILDEAHRGDKEESKRQHIYSILAKNGFLFNFSATFTDLQDIITTGFEYNLSSFISDGYGKQVLLLEQDLEAFKDPNSPEKQKVVLKILILLTYIKLFYEEVKEVDKTLYHNPLLLVLVNSVNDENSDLQLFFREMEKIGKEWIKDDLFNEVKEELKQELSKSLKYVYGIGEFTLNESKIDEIKYEHILFYVYNAKEPGDIEISYRHPDRKEALLKLKSTDKHFALIKTGDIPKWLKRELDRFQINHEFEKEQSYFEKINDRESPVNILLGSRSFYEGWDSNRPNIVCFINIGKTEDAKKFVLQSIGRGVRIEPIQNHRKRLRELYNSDIFKKLYTLYTELRDKVEPLETLFVLGTNEEVIKTLMEELKQKGRRGERIELSENQKALGHLLLIPSYKQSDKYIWEQGKGAKFALHKKEIELLKEYVNYIKDDRVLIFNYDTSPKIARKLRETLQDPQKYYKESDKIEYSSLDLMLKQVLKYISVVSQEFEGFKELSDEINHYKNIMVYIENIDELKNNIDIMKDYERKKDDLRKSFSNFKPEEYEEKLKEYEEKLREIEKASSFIYNSSELNIKYIAEHYYLPVLVSDKAEYISNIIKEESEVKFIKDLEDYLKRKNNKFKEFEWWFFSKLNEHLDKVFIPYYDPNTNSIKQFKPDFIFWLAKGKDYFIVFVDPKSTVYTSYQHKVDGYRALFEEGNEKEIKPIAFQYENYIVRVFLFLRTDDENKLSDGYRKYWFDNIDNMLVKLLSYLQKDNEQ